MVIVNLLKDREAWCAVVHEVTESDMTQQLNNNNSNLLKEEWHFKLVIQQVQNPGQQPLYHQAT